MAITSDLDRRLRARSDYLVATARTIPAAYVEALEEAVEVLENFDRPSVVSWLQGFNACSKDTEGRREVLTDERDHARFIADRLGREKFAIAEELEAAREAVEVLEGTSDGVAAQELIEALKGALREANADRAELVEALEYAVRGRNLAREVGKALIKRDSASYRRQAARAIAAGSATTATADFTACRNLFRDPDAGHLGTSQTAIR